MFDIGGMEMAFIALLALIVIGPKELPRLLRTVGAWVRKARSLAREFQSGLDDIVREADLEDAKKTIEGTRNFSIDKTIKETVDPTGSVDKEMQEFGDTAKEAMSGKDDEAKPADKVEDAAKTETKPAKEKTATEPGKEKTATKPAKEKAPAATSKNEVAAEATDKPAEPTEDFGTKKSA